MNSTNYIFGLRAIIEAIEAGKDIDKVMMRRDLGGELARELQELVKQYDIPVQRVPMERLDRITRKNHQGAIAFTSPISYIKLDQIIPTLYEEGKNPLIIILDGVTDTRNFGAIVRTAECAGAHAIVIPDRGSASATPDAVKTSAGALLRLPICRERNLTQAVTYLQQSGLTVVGATEKCNTIYTKVDMAGPTAIVMGAEDTGISDAILKKCDTLARIPILGNIGSLNVSVAAGIVMYEAIRQRNTE